MGNRGDVIRSTRMPVQGPPIIIVQLDLMLAGDRFVHIDIGAVFYLLLCERNGKISQFPLWLTKDCRRYEDFSIQEPGFDICYEIPYRPFLVVEKEIIYLSNSTILGVDFISKETFYIHQHGLF